MSFNSVFVATSYKSIQDMDDLRWNHTESKQRFRNPFAKDRDRILYSKSFLRLRGKTQVFMMQKNDYIRTRLTHTLEVAQLAKTIATALDFNLDLVEAIALGHDVGHTPFGHVGERTLAKMLMADDKVPAEAKGFKHNLQALRLYCDLEKGADYPTYKGLNLTKYTLWGISHHSSINQKKDTQGQFIVPLQTDHPIYDHYLTDIEPFWSFEGFVVALADEVAQRHHDIEDSLRYNIISREALLNEIEKFSTAFRYPEIQCFKRLRAEQATLAEPTFNSLFSRLVINMYLRDIIEQSKTNLKDLGCTYKIGKQQDFKEVKSMIPLEEYKKCISLSNQLSLCDTNFQHFLKSRVLNSYQAQAMDGKAEYIIRKLYKAFIDYPYQLPDTSLDSFATQIGIPYNRETFDANIAGNESILHRCVADYIGGMTDNFAYEEFDRLYGTRVR